MAISNTLNHCFTEQASKISKVVLYRANVMVVWAIIRQMEAVLVTAAEVWLYGTHKSKVLVILKVLVYKNLKKCYPLTFIDAVLHKYDYVLMSCSHIHFVGGRL